MEIENKYEVEQWDDYYARERPIHLKPKTDFFASYDIFLCDSILLDNIPCFEGRGQRPKICEVGCGDGKLVKKIAKMFGYEPWGIEYSAPGADLARREGIKVVQTDVFDEHAMAKYKNFFDVVFSYGFIEHILPVKKAVEAHLRILKPGGYLVLQVPRLKGFNYWKVKIFRPELLPLHNLDIMEEEKLRAACAGFGITEIVCKNYGTLKLRVPMATRGLRYFILKLITSVEYLTNPLLRFLFGKRGFETRLFSPAVIFIGQK